MTEHQSFERFGENVSRALADDELRGALRKATDLFSDRRRKALSEVPEWEELRGRARAIKDEVLKDLDRHLARFVTNAEAAGVVVHRATDAVAACRLVEEISRSAVSSGVPEIVKSKSMTTEEIELNEYLAARGMHPVETDLGEWIIQLAKERPSHIIVPAIHKTREQIARLFAEHLETDPNLGAEEMTAIAREFLRDRFARADVGISGVNFAIAETGSILLLENEGNIRLTTSLPRIHIAVMGIEKVIPRLADLAVFLRLLPRSGTGQHLTSYQSILTGPKRKPSDEGPSEMHIVLLDNGRSRMLVNPVERQSLACIRCGACLNACPVYQQIGGHAYGSVYPGPIGAIITPQLDGGEKAIELPFASSLCGACAEVCPVKIDIPELLLHLRAESRSRGAGGFGERMAFRIWSRMASSPRRFRFGSRLVRLLQRTRCLGFLPPVRAWRRGRELRPFAGTSAASSTFRDRWRAGLPSSRPVEPGRVSSAGDGRVEPPPRSASLDRFSTMLHSVGGTSFVAVDAAAAAAEVDRFLREHGVAVVACSDSELVATMVPATVDRLGAEASREDLLASGAGISSAQFGIAETGTLVLCSEVERHRLVSLVPPVHIAVLPKSRILDSLEDALARVRPEDSPEEKPHPVVTFVTGPSRTADIELTLVVGVHGPGALHVVVLEDGR